MGKRQVPPNATTSVDVAARVEVDNKLLPGDTVSMNYWNDMPAGYDAWLTTDVEGERRQERADYCADNHPDFDGQGECPECEAEDEHWAQGPDPDDINDQRREQQGDR